MLVLSRDVGQGVRVSTLDLVVTRVSPKLVTLRSSTGLEHKLVVGSRSQFALQPSGVTFDLIVLSPAGSRARIGIDAPRSVVVDRI